MRSPKYIKDKIKTILQLPAMPKIASDIVEMVDNPQTSAAQLGKVISTDQALTSKVLKIANSPFYGFPKRISTVDFAIIVLGFDALKEIVISISLISALQNQSDKYFDQQTFWNHSLTSAVIARRLARDVDYRITGEVFVAALLHDIGISILHKYFNNDFTRIIKIIRETDLTPQEAEESVLGVTHAEIGGWLAERWNLPPHLLESIALHHVPEKVKENPVLVALINTSDVISNILLDPAFESDKGIEFNDTALKILNLDGDELVKNYSELAISSLYNQSYTPSYRRSSMKKDLKYDENTD